MHSRSKDSIVNASNTIFECPVKELAKSLEHEDTYTTASILDPHSKLKWCKDGMERDHYKGGILSRMWKLKI